jgi:hypothetical protein
MSLGRRTAGRRRSPADTARCDEPARAQSDHWFAVLEAPGAVRFPRLFTWLRRCRPVVAARNRIAGPPFARSSGRQRLRRSAARRGASNPAVGPGGAGCGGRRSSRRRRRPAPADVTGLVCRPVRRAVGPGWLRSMPDRGRSDLQVHAGGDIGLRRHPRSGASTYLARRTAGAAGASVRLRRRARSWGRPPPWVRRTTSTATLAASDAREAGSAPATWKPLVCCRQPGRDRRDRIREAGRNPITARGLGAPGSCRSTVFVSSTSSSVASD